MGIGRTGLGTEATWLKSCGVFGATAMLLDLFDRLQLELGLTLGYEYNTVRGTDNGISIMLRQSFLPTPSPQSCPNRGYRTTCDRHRVVEISGGPTRFDLRDFYLKKRL